MNDYDKYLSHLIAEALQEDIGNGDHSTLCCIPSNKKGKAVLKIKQNCIIAGINVAQKIFSYQEPSASISLFKQDGDEVEAGETAFEVDATVHTILQCERVVLNCMQRMSGIATLTKQYTSKLKNYHTKILDTRKTTPNFRLLEKEAVSIGGAINHRFGLFDMILLKDNHIDFCGSITEAINKAWNYVQANALNIKIEVETRNLKDVKEVCAAGEGKVFRIMLDNFKPVEITEALKIINGKFETEASGGIALDNIVSYAETSVDYVSVGALIHQAKSIDLSLKAVVD